MRYLRIFVIVLSVTVNICVIFAFIRGEVSRFFVISNSVSAALLVWAMGYELRKESKMMRQIKEIIATREREKKDFKNRNV